MDPVTLYSPPNMLATGMSPLHLSITNTDPTPPGNRDKNVSRSHGNNLQTNKVPPRESSTDLAEEIKGLYRLLDVISEYGSNGCVDKIVIAQDSLERFINTICPGAYSSVTKVDFKTLNEFVIRPVGVYGSKIEIVRLLRSLNAVSEDIGHLLLLPTELGSSRPSLSSGLYVLAAEKVDPIQEHHFIIYWPEDSTWDDSVTSSVCRNRVTFMRYLTKICDQVVALLSTEHTASIVWGDEDDDTESLDVDIGDEDRLFTYEVENRNEQEESASLRPGFQMKSPLISCSTPPDDCPVYPSTFVPSLLHGEVIQGFWTVSYIQHHTRSTAFYQRPYNRLSLKQLLEVNALALSETLDEGAVQTLVDVAISNIFPEECKAWHAVTEDSRKSSRKEMIKRQEKVCEDLDSQEGTLRRALRDAVVHDVAKLFPSIERDRLSLRACSERDPDLNNEATQLARVDDLRRLYRGFAAIYERRVEDAKFGVVKGIKFEFLKGRIAFVRHLLNEHRDMGPEKRTELVQALLSEGGLRHAHPKSDKNRHRGQGKASLFTKIKGILPQLGATNEESLRSEMKKIADGTCDADFLLELKDIEYEDLAAQAQEAFVIAHTQLSSSIDATVGQMTRDVLRMQKEECKRTIQLEIEAKQRKVLGDARMNFILDVNNKSAGQATSVVRIDDVQQVRRSFRSPGYNVTGRIDVLEGPYLEFQVHLMDLKSDDKHNMQLDPKHVPVPIVNGRRSGMFRLPLGLCIVFHRLLENEKLLLILIDRDKHAIYLERLPEMNVAIKRARVIKTLSRDRIGEDVLFTYDEAKRTLVAYASAKMQLHAFVFDETFKTLRGQGDAIDLAPWYRQREISILQLSSVCGSDEEVALVDSNAHIRIFSFVTQQIKPASLQLPSLPDAVYSSPDGSCLLVLQTQGPQASLTAYHWDTFGSTDGISLQTPSYQFEGAVVTSMVNRGCIFLLTLDIDSHCVNSVAIDITRKGPDVVFQQTGCRKALKDGPSRAYNNLLDCHKEVWMRFPVLPAVKRHIITSLSERHSKSLTFITENPTLPFASYFSDLIQGFVKSTRKPVGDELRGIKVAAIDFESFWAKVGPNWKVSRYRFGEWLVDLFCLIPIHIAVCRENRLIPLENGAFSAELERSLLGADINQIVDKLSFGWYESIFQSYMVSKPVRVVSSMGQQSVGKSYSLNHLVDTSFAGSAMRTTEGVWMSVTPTDKELIVALDFEGVESIERSPQEDMLLVLLNTAISNLVLFRNNFAFGRDISGLFQSFQYSASMLDPAANPSLFQSTLVIIIKDVVESDQKEIAREFSLKFQKIVAEERDANFISRLHGGKLAIIPWPVVESKNFYKLFATIKNRLDLQKISHSTAGEFLHTIKTLMAKIMANDWGALSQTMAAHRAQSLTALLPIALATGFLETEPQLEPLKDFDKDLVLESNDTMARFAISGGELILTDIIETHLKALLESWSPSTPRQFIPDSEWVAELVSYLNASVDLRVNHVQSWLDCNLRRFEADHASIEELRRRFEIMVIELRTNVQLCGAQCISCNLLCIRSPLHEGEHNCNTNHKCAHSCGFCEDNPGLCGTRAGHAGKHICLVTAHLCGEPCKLFGRRGCLEDCTKVMGHADGDDHTCSAPVHMCGEPCALQGVILSGGNTYSCQERCSIPSGQVHETHSCDTRLCPSTCQICKRLCDGLHLHGLTLGTLHECGENHACPELCSFPGICQIETTPQSIQATFTGRHETFQYTKYTQVAKRLQCIRTIPPGQTSHRGPHAHSKEAWPFHFCEVRCESCDYFCTLPLGHSQQEHETSHGSMTKSRWGIDGPEETILELDGHTYSSNDEGAPLMCGRVCSSMGRHVHIDYCRTEGGGRCDGAEIQHINRRISPNPNKPKDAITHSLHWRRMGFKDPYTRDEQTSFSKCEAMCPGSEHSATAAGTGRPSYCVLPMFHSPRNRSVSVNGRGYISGDGHQFDCNDPVVMQQAFHVIFVIDRSSSMAWKDRLPLADAPVTEKIRQSANNRLGAVYSALYNFWCARHAATTANRVGIGARRDAYSVILFNDATTPVLTNDFTSPPDQLLDAVLGNKAYGNTDFLEALRTAGAVMAQHWSTERTPVMIFLSDGECKVPDSAIEALCNTAVRHGMPLSFHSISFGLDASASSFSRALLSYHSPSISRDPSFSLRRMADLALEIQRNAPRDPLRPSAVSVPSSFLMAQDTVQLAQIFLGIAESLRKPRGSPITHRATPVLSPI